MIVDDKGRRHVDVVGVGDDRDHYSDSVEGIHDDAGRPHDDAEDGGDDERQHNEGGGCRRRR